MSRGWTVTASAVVRGDFDAVVDWWMNDRRWAEWRDAVQYCTGNSIDWSETRNESDKIIEGQWATRRGTAASCVVVVHPAQRNADATVLRKSVTTTHTPGGSRRERTSVATVQTDLRRDGQKTRVIYENTYKMVGTCTFCQLVHRLRMARTARSELRALARRCETALGVPQRQWA